MGEMGGVEKQCCVTYPLLGFPWLGGWDGHQGSRLCTGGGSDRILVVVVIVCIRRLQVEGRNC